MELTKRIESWFEGRDKIYRWTHPLVMIRYWLKRLHYKITTVTEFEETHMWSIVVNNTTDNTINDVTLFDAHAIMYGDFGGGCWDKKTGNFYKNGIEIKNDFFGSFCTYQQILATTQTRPIPFSSMRLDILEGPVSQLKSGILSISQTAGGAMFMKPKKPLLDPYQNDKSIVILSNFDGTIDGMSKIVFNEVLPSSKILVSFYTETEKKYKITVLEAIYNSIALKIIAITLALAISIWIACVLTIISQHLK